MMINYGMEKMRFGQAVLSGQRIRLNASMQSLANLRGVAKAEIKFSIDIEGERKKALEGVAVFLYYFNNSITSITDYRERNSLHKWRRATTGCTPIMRGPA